MGILLNEFSLNGQYEDKKDFLDDLENIVGMQYVMKQSGINFLKSYEIMDLSVTPEESLTKIFLNRGSRDIRLTAFKRNLDLLGNPFWNDDQRHSEEDEYTCEYTDRTYGYSLAEACERDKSVISFLKSNFTSNKILINKNEELNTIHNFTTKQELARFLYRNDKINVLEYCKFMCEGTKISFQHCDRKYAFDGLEKAERDVFVNSFEKFIVMEWDEINSSSGLNFKPYNNKSLNKDWKRTANGSTIYKFRVSQKYRCLGYIANKVFYVLVLEKDHTLSDKG